MNSIRIKIGIFSFAMMALLNLAGCASIVLGFSARPITATVVDAETKEPLQGVIVVAHWQLVQGGFLDSSIPAGELMVMEAITDADGKFHFPAWGPKYVFMGRMKYFDPELILFKPGYEYETFVNQWNDYREYKAFRSSDWDGQTIKLKRFIGNLDQYARHLTHLDISLNFALAYPKLCEWKQVPMMILALQKQKSIFNTKGIDNSGIHSIGDIPARDCGAPNEYFIGVAP